MSQHQVGAEQLELLRKRVQYADQLDAEIVIQAVAERWAWLAREQSER